jgi:hypothetical protein
MDQLLGQQDATGLCDGDGRGADVLAEETPELAIADLKSIGKRRDISAIERAALDQFQSP